VLLGAEPAEEIDLGSAEPCVDHDVVPLSAGWRMDVLGVRKGKEPGAICIEVFQYRAADASVECSPGAGVKFIS